VGRLVRGIRQFCRRVAKSLDLDPERDDIIFTRRDSGMSVRSAHGRSAADKIKAKLKSALADGINCSIVNQARSIGAD